MPRRRIDCSSTVEHEDLPGCDPQSDEEPPALEDWDSETEFEAITGPGGNTSDTDDAEDNDDVDDPDAFSSFYHLKLF